MVLDDANPLEIELPSVSHSVAQFGARARLTVAIQVAASGDVTAASIVQQRVEPSVLKLESRFGPPLLEAVRRWKYPPSSSSRRIEIHFLYDTIPCVECPSSALRIFDPPATIVIRAYEAY